LKKIELGQTLGILANVGVIGGLILVAIQINQNTDIAKAQLANDFYLADLEIELAMMGENPVKSWVKAVYAPDEINQEDAAVLDRYFNYGLIQIDRLQQMQQMGLADEELIEVQRRLLTWHLGNELGRRWWIQIKRYYPEDNVRKIDDALADTDFRENQQLLDALLPSAETDQD
jgi:hypothetical protein